MRRCKLQGITLNNGRGLAMKRAIVLAVVAGGHRPSQAEGGERRWLLAVLREEAADPVGAGLVLGRWRRAAPRRLATRITTT